MIVNEFVVQYAFPPCQCDKCNEEEQEQEWKDYDPCNFSFDPDNPELRTAAENAAKVYAIYLNLREADPEFPIAHRVIHRISSDIPVE